MTDSPFGKLDDIIESAHDVEARLRVIERLEDRIDLLKARVDGVGVNQDAFASRLTAVENKARGAEISAQDAHNRLQKHDVRLTDLEGSQDWNNDPDGAVEDLQHLKIKELMREIDRRARIIEELDIKNEDLKKELDRKAQLPVFIPGTCEELTPERAAGEIASLRDTIDELKEVIGDKDRKIKRLQETDRALRERLQRAHTAARFQRHTTYSHHLALVRKALGLRSDGKGSL